MPDPKDEEAEDVSGPGTDEEWDEYERSQKELLELPSLEERLRRLIPEIREGIRDGIYENTVAEIDDILRDQGAWPLTPEQRQGVLDELGLK